jgi:hypothetical protein
MSDVIWSDDADLFLAEPEVMRLCAAALAVRAEGTDGTTDATGKVFDSASYADWTAAGVDINEDSEGDPCTHFLEIVSGAYQGFYKIVTAVAATLTLDRPISASATALAWRIRTFQPWHDEAHQHYQDWIAKLEGIDAADWDDEDFHSRAERKLRDLCAARVLGRLFFGASRQKDDLCWSKGQYYHNRERQVFGELGELELDDGNTDVDSRTSNLGGSVEVGVS